MVIFNCTFDVVLDDTQNLPNGGYTKQKDQLGMLFDLILDRNNCTGQAAKDAIQKYLVNQGRKVNCTFVTRSFECKGGPLSMSHNVQQGDQIVVSVSKTASGCCVIL